MYIHIFYIIYLYSSLLGFLLVFLLVFSQQITLFAITREDTDVHKLQHDSVGLYSLAGNKREIIIFIEKLYCLCSCVYFTIDGQVGRRKIRKDVGVRGRQRN